MEPNSRARDTTPPVASLVRVDALCDRFEAALHGLERPRIEDYLADAGEQDRPLLLRELLSLEIPWRRSRGETASVEEYQARFPDGTEAISAAFATRDPNRPDTTSGAGSAGKEAARRAMAADLLGEAGASRDAAALVAALEAWAVGDCLPREGVAETFGLVDRSALRQLEGVLRAILESPASPGGEAGGEAPDGVPEEALAGDAERSANDPGRSASASRFQILEPYREGSLGRVFLAYDTELERNVALKQIKEEYASSPDHRARFLREAAITGQLEHPAIVPVYGLGFDAHERPYYAMKMIRGETLEEAIGRLHAGTPGPRGKGSKLGSPKRTGPRTPSSALRAPSPRRGEGDGEPSADGFRLGGGSSGRHRPDGERDGVRGLLLGPITAHSDDLRGLLRHFIDVCDAIAYAHDRGVLHRDIKPTNVILGAFGETVILDWGLAKVIGDRRSGGAAGPVVGMSGGAATETQAGWAMGTPAYMSPEQAAGDVERLGPACDVYGLGATLYAILTGRPPVGGSETLEVLQKVREGRFPDPRDVNPSIPRPLEAICLKAMASAIEDRYATAIELREDLENWLAGEPVSAWKEPRRVRARRWIGRHLTAVSIAGVVVVALVIVAGMAGYLLHRASVVEILRQADAQRHAEHIQEEARRHAAQVDDMTYVNAEKTAGEIVARRGPGWASRAIDKVREAAGIATPMRSVATLRSRAVEAFGGFDLQERDGGRLTRINTAALAFSRDGRRLAVGEHHRRTTAGSRVQIFQVSPVIEKLDERSIAERGEDTKRTGVSALAFSPDGRWLAAGLRDGRIEVWDTGVPDSPPVELAGHSDQIRGLGFTPDGSALVSGSKDRTVRLWAANPGWKPTLRLDVEEIVSCLTLSPDGKRVALGCDSSGQVFDLSNEGADASASRSLHLEYRRPQLAFSPDGRQLASSDFDRRITIGPADGTRGRLLIDTDYGVSHVEDIHRLEFHPDGSLLVSTSSDNTLKVWDLAADRLLFKMASFTEAVVVPAFSPDGRTLAVGTSEGTVLYDVHGPDAMTTRGLQPDPVEDFAFVPRSAHDRHAFATTSHDLLAGPASDAGTLAFWSPGSIVPRVVLAYGGGQNNRPISALDGHPGRRIVACNEGSRVGLYDGDRGRLERSIDERLATALRFSPDGQQLWGILDEVQIVSWSVDDSTLKTRWVLNHTIERDGRIGLTCLAVGARRVVAGSRSGHVYVLDATDGRRAKTLEAAGPIQSIALSPDESTLVCGQLEGPISLFQLPSGVRIAEIPAHQDTVSSVAFHPQGRLLASASRDRSLALWDVRDPSRPVEILRFPSPSGHPILSARFSPDGRMLAMLVQHERAVHFWDLQDLRERLGHLGLDWE